MYCVLGDCYKSNCHNCFPVKDCSFKHDWCSENGYCEEIIDPSNEEYKLMLKKKKFIDKKNKILVTGCVGFIGSHLCEYLLKNNLNSNIIKLIGIITAYMGLLMVYSF